MSRQSYDQTIDENTPAEILQEIIQAASRTSDPNIVKAAGRARAELERRAQEHRTKELVSQIDAQREMIEMLVSSTRDLSAQQAQDARDIATKQTTIANSAWYAAWGSAVAALLAVVVSLLAFYRPQ